MKLINVEVEALNEQCKKCPNLEIGKMARIDEHGKMVNIRFYCRHQEICDNAIKIDLKNWTSQFRRCNNECD